MKIIHKYLLKHFLKTLFMMLVALTVLFLLFDFFEKIDKFSAATDPLVSTFSYFFYKIPYTLSMMFPLSILFSAMISIGLLSKNSEITAMRASGLKLSYLMKPIFYASLIFSIFSLILNEINVWKVFNFANALSTGVSIFLLFISTFKSMPYDLATLMID